jgi:hypothetical protein
VTRPDASGSALRRLAGALRQMPLWSRWLATLLVYAFVIVAIVIVVRSANGSGGSSGASAAEAQALAEANREGRIAIAEDEAPHTAVLASGADVQLALEHAIAADVRARVAHGQLTGPLQSVRCLAVGPSRGGRRELHCEVRSADIDYPFVGVADARALRLTWCKVDPPPAGSGPLEVPVSPRCQA